MNCFLLEKSTNITQGYLQRGFSGTTSEVFAFHEVFHFTCQEDARSRLNIVNTYSLTIRNVMLMKLFSKNTNLHTRMDGWN